jgi:two-component system sensor kinase FixL
MDDVALAKFTAFNTLPHSAVLANVDGLIHGCNASAVDLFGYPENALIGKKYNELYCATDSFFIQQRITACLQSKTPQQLHTRLLKKDHTTLSCQTNIAYIDLDKPYLLFAHTSLNQRNVFNIHHYQAYESSLKSMQKENALLKLKIGALEDSLQQKNHIESFLRESEQRFRLLAENASDVISRLSPCGEFLYVSPSVKTLLQYTPETLTGRSIFEFCHHNDIEPFKKSLSKLKSSKQPFTLSYRIRRKDGIHIWFETNFKTIRDPDSNQVIELQAASRDVTESIIDKKTRTYDKRLAKAFKLTTMEEMASGMAHEINQPLAAITNYTLGCVRLLERGNFDTTKIIEVMKKAALQAERAGEIIHRLKTFFCKGKLFTESEKVNTVIRESISFIRLDLQQAKIKVKYQLAKKIPSIPLDRIQFQQVVINLTQNAIEAMQDHECEEKIITITSHAVKDKHICIEFRDTGPGFTQSVARRVYAPFFTTKQYGTGMGLSICRSIIEAHGGKLSICAKTKDSNGLITITLPIEQTKT